MFFFTSYPHRHGAMYCVSQLWAFPIFIYTARGLTVVTLLNSEYGGKCEGNEAIKNNNNNYVNPEPTIWSLQSKLRGHGIIILLHPRISPQPCELFCMLSNIG